MYCIHLSRALQVLWPTLCLAHRLGNSSSGNSSSSGSNSNLCYSIISSALHPLPQLLNPHTVYDRKLLNLTSRPAAGGFRWRGMEGRQFGLVFVYVEWAIGGEKLHHFWISAIIHWLPKISKPSLLLMIWILYLYPSRLGLLIATRLGCTMHSSEGLCITSVVLRRIDIHSN